MTVRRVVDPAAIARASRHLRRLLRTTKSTITLRIESCDARTAERLLRRLARYGDRVSLQVAETLREAVDVDWSRFEMVLEPGT
jgi:cytosine/adenosine deaminase-related metal-dependent hydrolase